MDVIHGYIISTVRYLGFCPAHLQAAPVEMVAFLARQLQGDPTALQTYGMRRMTRSAHFNAVLNHLGFRRVHPEDHTPILTWLTERALEHDKPTLLLQMVCEHLKQQHLLRPAVTTLERWVVTARMQAHHESLHRLQPLLTPDRLALLDSLLIPEQDKGKTQLSWLRQHATSNTPPALLDTLSKLTLLQKWEVDQWEMSALNGLTYVPRVIVTDQLKSYGAAKREVLPSVVHRHHRYLNNRAENSHQPTRQRERRMQGFKSPGHAQRFLAAYGPIAQHFRPRRHRMAAVDYHREMRQRFDTWQAITSLPTAA